MTLTHTDPTDPWTAEEDDDVPMRPDGNVRIAWRDTPHHYIEQTALVYLHHISCRRRRRIRKEPVRSVANAFAGPFLRRPQSWSAPVGGPLRVRVS
jgi:hypothetical protein